MLIRASLFSYVRRYVGEAITSATREGLFITIGLRLTLRIGVVVTIFTLFVGLST